MSKLTDEQRDRVESYSDKCSECGETIRKCFCGKCDEPYFTGHKQTCSRYIPWGERGNHDRC
jgi:hypothetical protein